MEKNTIRNIEVGSIRFLNKNNIRDIIVFQSKTKRVWLSEIMEDYRKQEETRERKRISDVLLKTLAVDVNCV